MKLGNIVRAFALTSLFALTSHTANAQDLLARQAPIDRRAKALDTVVITRLREAEEIDEPSSELYNDWNNVYAHRLVHCLMSIRLIYAGSACQHQVAS